MTYFTDKLRLRERAEEDIYFARRDRELIAARKAAAARDSPSVSGDANPPHRVAAGDLLADGGRSAGTRASRRPHPGSRSDKTPAEAHGRPKSSPAKVARMISRWLQCLLK